MQAIKHYHCQISFAFALLMGGIAHGQAFFDITTIYNGTADGGQSATGFSDTDWPNYNEVQVTGRGGVEGTFTNGPISGIWEIDLIEHPTVYDGATSRSTSPLSTLSDGSAGNRENKNNAFVYDVSPTQSASGVEISLQGFRGANQDMKLEFAASPTSLSGSLDDPVPLLAVYPTAPAVQGVGFQQNDADPSDDFVGWGYQFNVFNHATRYDLAWDPAESACPAILGEPLQGQVSSGDDGDQIANGGSIDSVPLAVLSQQWYAYLPPNVSRAEVTIGGLAYYDVLGFDILYYDTQLSIAVGQPTTAGGAIANVADAGDTIDVFYTLENIGDVTVLSPTVDDTELGPVVYDSGDDDGDGELDPGEAWIFKAVYVIQGDFAGGTDYSTIISTIADGGSVTTSSAPRYCGDTPVRSEQPRILEVPTEPVAIILEKCVSGNAEDFTFNIANLLSPTQTHTPAANSCSVQVTEYVTDVEQPVTIEEVLPPGWNFLDASCTNAPNAATAGTTLTIPVADLTPGNEITCTFNNEQQVDLQVRKRMDDEESGGTFAFTTTNSDLPSFDLTTSGSTVATIDGLILDPGADFTISETLEDAYDNTDINCVNLTTSLNNLNATNIVGPGTASLTLDESFYAPGDSVRCTYRNARKETTLTVLKTWENMDGTAHTVTISADGENEASQGVTANSDGTTTAILDLKVFGGETISLSETDLSGFAQQLSCTGASPAGNTSATLIVPELAADPIVCIYTNIKFPNLPNWLRFTKQSDGATGLFDFTTANTDADGTTIQLDTSAGNPIASDFYEITNASLDVSFTEIPAPGFAYDSISCRDFDDPTGPSFTPVVSGTAGGGATFTFAAGTLGPNTKIFCDIINIADEYPLTINKQWVNGDTSATTISIVGNTSSTGSATAPNNVSGAPVTQASVAATTFYVNGEVTVSETSLPNYTASLSCDQGLVSGANPWTVDTNGATVAIDCTITNTRRTSTLSLSKSWIDALAGDSVDIAVQQDGTSGNVLAHQSIATDGNSTTDAGSIPIFGGETLSITEDDLSGDGYSQSLSCTGGASVVGTGTGAWTVDIPATIPSPIFCTITNDRAAGNLTIAKQVTNATQGSFSFSSGTLDAFTLNTSGGTAGHTAELIAPGTYDVSEAAQAGWLLTGASCDNGSGTANTATGTLTNITVSDGEDVTCTFFNRRNTGAIQFEKTWVDAAAGHTATITATGDEVSNISWTTPATAGGDQVQDSSGFTFDVYGGETITLAESLSFVGYSDSGFTCDSGISVAADATFTVPSSPPPLIRCAITNTLDAIPFTLDKTWVNAAVGDVADFTIDSLNSGTGQSVADTANETDADVVVDEVVLGQSYILSETLLPSYAKTLVCTGATVGTPFVASGLMNFNISIPATSTAAACTLTNTRRSASLSVHKTWVDAGLGDTAAISVASTTDATVNLSHSATAAGQTVSLGTVPIYADTTVTLAETPIAGYDTTLACDRALDNLSAGNADFILDASQPADVICTWTNTRASLPITLIKNWVNADLGAPAEITVSGGDAAPGVVAFSADQDGSFAQTLTTFNAFAGETLSFAETALDPAYAMGAFTCDTLSLDAAGTVTIPDSALPAAATCEITNTRASTTLNLHKVWENAGVSDTATFTLAVDGAVVASPASTSDATQALDTQTDSAITSLTAYAGEVIALGEDTIPPGYDVSLTCVSDGVTIASNAAGGTAGFTVANDATAANPIDCTWTNARQTATLTLGKTWVNAEAAATTTLSAQGLETASAAAPADGVIAVETETYPTLTSMTLYAGETITLAETGLSANYSPALVCDNGLNVASTTGSFTVPTSNPGDVSCVWTNTRNTATLTLEKMWVEAAGNEQLDINIASPLIGSLTLPSDADADATNPSQTINLGTRTLYAGETLALGEDALTNYDQVLDCGSGPVGTDGSGTLSVPATPVDLTCTWTNTRRAIDITVVKNWVGADLNDTATLDVSGGDLSPGALPISATQAGNFAQTVAVVRAYAGETLTFTEPILDSSYTKGSFTCDTLSPDGSGVVTLSDTPPAAARCEITNSRKTAPLTLSKIWTTAEASASATLSATINGVATTGVATADAAETVATETFADVASLTVAAGQSVGLAETLTSGDLANYDVTLTCLQDGAPLTLSSTGTGAADMLIPDTISTSEISCTWENTRKFATLSVGKVWINADAGATTTLGLTGINTSSAAIPADGVIAQETEAYVDVLTQTIFAGETLALSETGLEAIYSPSLSCDNGTTSTTATGGFTVPSTPANVTCTWTNRRNQSTIRLIKSWDRADANETGTVTLTAPLLGTLSDTFTADGDALNADVDEVMGTVTVFAGEEVTLAETVLSGYTQSLTCDGAAIGSDGAGTYTVPNSPAPLDCVWTNARNFTVLTVFKEWVDAAGNPSATISVSGGFLNAPAAPQTDTVTATSPTQAPQQIFTAFEVFEGETITLQETVLSPGFSTSQFSCDTLAITPLTDGAGDAIAGSGTVTLGATPPATARCSITNSRNIFELYLNKIWENAEPGISVNITADGPSSNVAVSAPADGVAGEGVETYNNLNSPPMLVKSGETITLAEVQTPGSGVNTTIPGSYSTELLCTDGLSNFPVVSTSFGSATFTVPPAAASPALSCTWTNTRNQAELTLQKTWIDADANETTTLSATSQEGLANTSGAAAADATPGPQVENLNTVATVTVYAGDTLTLGESSVPANYEAVLDCPAGPGHTRTGNDVEIGDTPADFTCRWTNTRRQATLTIEKVWIDANEGEVTTLALISPMLGTVILPANADNDGTNANEKHTFTTNPATAAQLVVYGGDAIILSESILAGYDQTLTCNGVSVGTNGSGTFTVPDAPINTTCTFTNTRRSTRIDVVKNWVDADQNDAAEITITGGDLMPPVQTVTASNDGTFAQNVVSFTAFAGETLTFIESDLDPSYTPSAFSCNTLTLDASGGVTLGNTPPAKATCAVTNTRRKTTVNVSVVWENAEPGASVDAQISDGANTATNPATANAAPGVESESLDDVSSQVVAAGDSVTVSQSFTAGTPAYYTSTLQCFIGATPLPLTGSETLDGAFVVPDSVNGGAIDCTFTNTRNSAALTLHKTWVDADANETVTLTTTSAEGFPNASAAAMANATMGPETEVLANRATIEVFAGDTVTLSEGVVPANYSPTLICDGGSGYMLTGEVLSIGTNPTDFDCRWTNTRNTAILTVVKQWEFADQGESTTVSITSPMLGTQTPTSTADGDAATDSETDTVTTFTLYGGETLTLSETSLTGYDQTLDCGAGEIGSDGAGSLAIADAPAAQTCTWTNTRQSTLISLEKHWVGASIGDQATLRAVGGDKQPGDATIGATSDGDFTQSAGTPFRAFAGETYTFSEPTLDAAYVAGDFTCDQLTLDTNGSVTLGSTPPTPVVCSVTNTRTTVTLTLSKTWVNAAANAATTLTADNGTGTSVSQGANANANPVLETELLPNVAMMTVAAGETVDLAEVGLDPGYATNITCIDGPDTLVTRDAATAQFTVPNSFNGTSIDCTFTNTRLTSTLTLGKQWRNADGGVSTTLNVTGLEPGIASSSVAGVGFVGDVSDPALINTTIYAGETLSFTETGLSAGYSAELRCNGAVVTSTTSGTFVVPDAPAPLDCTWENTRNETLITLNKIWVNADAGAVAEISATGGQLTPGVDSVTAAAGNSTQGVGLPFTAYAGETITLSETDLSAGYTPGSFDCGALSVASNGEIHIPDAPAAAYTCAITNTRNQAEITLIKDWVNAEAAQSVTPTATGQNGTLSFTATSDGASLVETESFTSPATLTVFAGETLALSEGSVPNAYSADLVCDDAGTDLTVTPGAGIGEGSILIPDEPSAITCRWTNTRRSADLTLIKTWINADYFQSVDLTATGMNTIGAGVATAVADDSLTQTQSDLSVGFMTIYANETIDLAETVPAGYAAILSCDAGTFTAGAAAGTGTLTLGTDPSDVNCTWINTRLETQLTLVKNWVNPISGATATLEAESPIITLPPTDLPGAIVDANFNDIPATPVTATGPTDTSQGVGPITAYSGETFELAETALSDGFTAGPWDCGAVALGGTDLTIPEAPDPAITCQITNTRNSFALIVDVQWYDANVGDSAAITVAGIDSANAASTAGAVDELQTNALTTSIYAGETLDLSQALPPGYSAQLVCTNAGVSGTAPDWSVGIPLDQTQPVRCTLTNDRRPTLTLQKVSNGSVGTFDFTVNNAAPAAITLTTLTPGVSVSSAELEIIDLAQDLVIAETLQFGWATDTIVCDDQQGGITGVSGTNEITIAVATLASAQDVVCVFTNTISLNDLRLTKSVDPVVASAGESVTYTITATNLSSAASPAGQLIDTLPFGLTYVSGSAVLSDANGSSAVEPIVAGADLTWAYDAANAAPIDALGAGETLTLEFEALVTEGTTRDALNSVVHTDAFGAVNSAVADALLTIIEDPGYECTTIIGTIWDTQNDASTYVPPVAPGNAQGDQNLALAPLETLPRVEPAIMRQRGLAGVRIVTPDGQVVTSDDRGRYSIPCVRTRGARGAESRLNVVPLKVIESTLPLGFEVDGFNPRLVNTTPGKVTVENIGAHFTGADNQACAVPFDADELAQTPGSNIFALQDTGAGDSTCRHAFWFVTAQLRLEGDGNVPLVNRTASDGRLSAYFKGYISGETLLTLNYYAEGNSLSDFAQGVFAPDVDRLLDEIEADDMFPVFADRSTIVDDTPTSGGFYIRLENEDDRFVFGDVAIEAGGNSLAPLRGQIYGALLDLNWDGDGDGDGDGRLTGYAVFDAFSKSAEVFTGLGTSSFYLAHVNILPQSLNAEIRVSDTLTGQVLQRVPLFEMQDYRVNEGDGVLRLNQPLMSFLPGVQFGTTVALYVAYEYIPATLEAADREVGARFEAGLSDSVTAGLTYQERDTGGQDQQVMAGDIEWRFGDQSYLRLELAESSGTAPGVLASNDGGLTFALLPGAVGTGQAATIALIYEGEDFGQDGLRISAYLADVDTDFAGIGAGASTPGGTAGSVNIEVPIGEDLGLELAASARNLGAVDAQSAVSIALDANPDDTLRTGAGLIAQSSSGARVVAGQVFAGTQVGTNGALQVTATSTLSQEEQAADLDAIDITYTQDFEDGGSIGITVREDASGTRAGLSVASADDGPFETYAEVSQQGGEFGDLGNAWATTGFRYSATDQVSLFGETRQSLDNTSTQTNLGLLIDGDDSTASASLLYDRGLATRLRGISLAYGWEDQVGEVSGAIRGEYVEELDVASGEIRDLVTLSYLGNTFREGPYETQFEISYNRNALRGANGLEDAGQFELEAALAYRPGELDRVVLMAVYSADYSYATQAVSGVSTFNQSLDQTVRLDLTYQINPWLTFGAAYSARASLSSASRTDALRFDQLQQLGIVRLDAKISARFGVVLEGRAFTSTSLTNQQFGTLEYVYFDISENARLAVGHSQTAIGEDLDNLGEIERGWFVELNSQY